MAACFARAGGELVVLTSRHLYSSGSVVSRSCKSLKAVALPAEPRPEYAVWFSATGCERSATTAACVLTIDPATTSKQQEMLPNCCKRMSGAWARCLPGDRWDLPVDRLCSKAKATHCSIPLPHLLAPALSCPPLCCGLFRKSFGFQFDGLKTGSVQQVVRISAKASISVCNQVRTSPDPLPSPRPDCSTAVPMSKLATMVAANTGLF
jgi:hypothetical protein